MQMIKLLAVAVAAMSLSQAASAAVAQPSCAQVICLSPAPGTPAPQACMPVRQVYFSIRVYDPSFDPDATAAARRAFLSTCLTARQKELQTIDNKYGRLVDDPIVY